MITIVSGLPRSGTSMAMQMLQAGGLTLLTDGLREPDDSNPRGYHEFERVKKLKTDKAWMAEADGHVVKVISQLLTELPADHDYKILFIERDMNEILTSQETMLTKTGQQGAQVSRDQLAKAFHGHLIKVKAWLEAQANMDTLYLSYASIQHDAAAAAKQINAFLGGTLDEEAMSSAVDPSLHRARSADA